MLLTQLHIVDTDDFVVDIIKEQNDSQQHSTHGSDSSPATALSAVRPAGHFATR